MNYYRHYKNMPYKVLSIAKHSETLEDFVVYESCYDNLTAKIWIRPKQMFFENITDSKAVVKPRFEKLNLDIKTFTEVSEIEIKIIADLMQNIFGEWNEKDFKSRFLNYKNYYLAIAYIDQIAVGFKLGYALDQQKFYSWLGGVIKDHQRFGVANDLMINQHAWCKQQGYEKIQTKTENKYRSMLMLNLKHQFEVIGTSTDSKNVLKIILEKNLV